MFLGKVTAKRTTTYCNWILFLGGKGLHGRPCRQTKTTTTTKENKILNMYMTPYALSDLKSLLQAAQNSSGGTSESLEPRPSASVA